MDAGRLKEEGFKENHLWVDTRDHPAGCAAAPEKNCS
jgi:hypothetical protein